MSKAKTKAAKRRNKLGRPYLPAQEREPNGRPSRRKHATTEREREVKQVAMQARQNVYGFAEAKAERPEAGHVLGRLYLRGLVRRHHLEAGKRLAEVYARYYGLTGIPFPSARAQDLFRVRGMPGETDQVAARAASNDVMKIEGTLGLVDTAGRPVTSVVKRVCLQDSEEGVLHGFMLAHLRKGLDAVADHFGIAASAA